MLGEFSELEEIFFIIISMFFFRWAVLLMGIAFVIFMAIFIKCFAIHTPSSNPRLAKNLHFTETLRRPVRALQQKVKKTNFFFSFWFSKGLLRILFHKFLIIFLNFQSTKCIIIRFLFTHLYI